IDEHDAPILLLSKMPREVRRQSRGADTTSSADESDHFAKLLANLPGSFRIGAQMQRLTYKLRGHRLDDVIGDSGVQQIAIETDLVALADRDNGYPGLANISQDMHLR